MDILLNAIPELRTSGRNAKKKSVVEKLAEEEAAVAGEDSSSEMESKKARSRKKKNPIDADALNADGSTEKKRKHKKKSTEPSGEAAEAGSFTFGGTVIGATISLPPDPSSSSAAVVEPSAMASSGGGDDGSAAHTSAAAATAAAASDIARDGAVPAPITTTTTTTATTTTTTEPAPAAPPGPDFHEFHYKGLTKNKMGFSAWDRVRGERVYLGYDKDVHKAAKIRDLGHFILTHSTNLAEYNFALPTAEEITAYKPPRRNEKREKEEPPAAAATVPTAVIPQQQQQQQLQLPPQQQHHQQAAMTFPPLAFPQHNMMLPGTTGDLMSHAARISSSSGPIPSQQPQPSHHHLPAIPMMFHRPLAYPSQVVVPPPLAYQATLDTHHDGSSNTGLEGVHEVFGLSSDHGGVLDSDAAAAAAVASVAPESPDKKMMKMMPDLDPM